MIQMTTHEDLGTKATGHKGHKLKMVKVGSVAARFDKGIVEGRLGIRQKS